MVTKMSALKTQEEEEYAIHNITGDSHFSYILSEKDCAKKLCESKKMDL